MKKRIQLSKENMLLTQCYAVTHPSLPNYPALTGGGTFGVSIDCTNCYLNAPSLPDRIEASGRTWKTYQEDLPSPYFVSNSGAYAQNHNPFIYFDSIRDNGNQRKGSVVSLNQLDRDLAASQHPVMPSSCRISATRPIPVPSMLPMAGWLRSARSCKRHRRWGITISL